MQNENLLQRVNLTVLYPPFAEKVEILVHELQLRGLEYWAISGERTWAEQKALYAQGRTAPGKIVTKAKAGQSAHNFAIAVDFAKDAQADRAGLQPDWDVDSYKALAEAAQAVGLEAGYFWKFTDAPHIQLPLHLHGLELAHLRLAYERGGKVGVFRVLDQYQW